MTAVMGWLLRIILLFKSIDSAVRLSRGQVAVPAIVSYSFWSSRPDGVVLCFNSFYISFELKMFDFMSSNICLFLAWRYYATKLDLVLSSFFSFCEIQLTVSGLFSRL